MTICPRVKDLPVPATPEKKTLLPLRHASTTACCFGSNFTGGGAATGAAGAGGAAAGCDEEEEEEEEEDEDEDEDEDEEPMPPPAPPPPLGSAFHFMPPK